MRISDWSSDVCSSDLRERACCAAHERKAGHRPGRAPGGARPVPDPARRRARRNRMNDAFAYDSVDYPGWVRPQSHPSRLAAIARLHGIAAASPTLCRYLEIGCGDGADMLPLALAYPHARFVGIDLSATAIARGEQLRARLGLTNPER